jgi:hypothetical protein
MPKIATAERKTPIQSRPLSVCSLLARGIRLPGATKMAPIARANDAPAATKKKVLHPAAVYCVVIPARTSPIAVPTGAPAPRPAKALDLAGPSGKVVPIRPIAAGVTLSTKNVDVSQSRADVPFNAVTKQTYPENAIPPRARKMKS